MTPPMTPHPSRAGGAGVAERDEVYYDAYCRGADDARRSFDCPRAFNEWRAEALPPLPTRPRVVQCNLMSGTRYFRFANGRIEVSDRPDTAWIAAEHVHIAAVDIIADLRANPTEVVESEPCATLTGYATSADGRFVRCWWFPDTVEGLPLSRERALEHARAPGVTLTVHELHLGPPIAATPALPVVPGRA